MLYMLFITGIEIRKLECVGHAHLSKTSGQWEPGYET